MAGQCPLSLDLFHDNLVFRDISKQAEKTEDLLRAEVSHEHLSELVIQRGQLYPYGRIEELLTQSVQNDIVTLDALEI